MTRREMQAPPGGGAANEPMESALQWFAVLQDGAATDEDRAAFETWYAAAAENGEAYARVADLWGAPEFAAALAGASGTVAIPRRPVSAAAVAAPRARRHLWGACLSAIAAVVLVGVFLGADLSSVFGPKADYRTGVGEIRKVALSDGSTLTLNTDSAVRVDIGAGARRIDLMEGESFFEVVRDETRPFVVMAGRTAVRVLGTAFSVYRDEDRITVAVKSGIVSVLPTVAGGADIVLSPGQRAHISLDGAPQIRWEGGNGVFAWLAGRILFRDARLDGILADLDRYYDGWIYTVGDIGAVRVSGNFRLDEPAAVVRALAQSAGARVTHLPGDILILR